MGMFRLFLAFNVFLGHFSINTHIPAVESFFILSGFYMSLVLNEKYVGKKKSYFLFIKNRFLRIYPSYFFVLLLFVLLFIVRGQFQFLLPNFPKLLENIALITNYKYYFPLGNYTQNLIDGPAWSLGIEMIFYLMAPFILRSKRLVFLALIVSFILNRMFTTAKFFQIFYLFFLGAISYLIYLKIRKIGISVLLQNKFVVCSLLFFAAGFIFFLVPVLPHFEGLIDKIYYLQIMLIIPFVFPVISKSIFDKFLGDLSYPLYICHMFIIEAFPRLSFELLTLAVLVLSFTIFILIDKPIQEYKLGKKGFLRLKLPNFLGIITK